MGFNPTDELGILSKQKKKKIEKKEENYQQNR